MMAVLALATGLVLGLALVGYTRGKPWRRELRILAIGLVVAALIYVAFAIGGVASARWLGLESVGVLLFGGVAWLGFRRWPAVLAAGWVAHVLWDVLLHLEGAGAAYTPGWYPWLCLSFDLVVAGTILLRMPRASASRPGA
jgi:hypothetical protein